MGYNVFTMFKPHTVLGLGLWLILISFLGVESVWRIRLYILTGIVLVAIYLFNLAKRTLLRLASEQAQKADTFVENGGMVREKPTPHHDAVS